MRPNCIAARYGDDGPPGAFRLALVFMLVLLILLLFMMYGRPEGLTCRLSEERRLHLK